MPVGSAQHKGALDRDSATPVWCENSNVEITPEPVTIRIKAGGECPPYAPPVLLHRTTTQT
jgi:hypothetical protein